VAHTVGQSRELPCESKLNPSLDTRCYSRHECGADNGNSTHIYVAEAVPAAGHPVCTVCCSETVHRFNNGNGLCSVAATGRRLQRPEATTT